MNYLVENPSGGAVWRFGVSIIWMVEVNRRAVARQDSTAKLALFHP
jgi:hypothetical protein